MKTPLAPITKLKHFRQTFYTDEVIQKCYGPGIKLCLDISQTGGSLWGIYMTVELPLFIKDLGENPLSKQEVQNAFSQLIECADLTERQIFNNQDLQLESLNLPIRENKELESVHLRNSNVSNYSPTWKKQGQHFILESDYWLEIFDIEKKSMMENHNNLYVKTFKKKNKWIIQTAYLTYDAQESEIDILEKHHNVVSNNLGW